jgi:MFS family permease
VERAGDNLGAVVGPLLASILVATVGLRTSFFFALIPGTLAAVSISLAAARARRMATAGQVRERARLELGGLRRAGLFRPLLPVALFELGNITTTLLILRATQLLEHAGRSPRAAASVAILLYAGHNLTAAIVAFVGGAWVDRRGPRLMFAAGAAAYVLAYGGFALPIHHWLLLAGCFCLAGAGIGLAETAESTLVAQLLPDRLRGSGFGLLGGLQSAGDFLSSTIVGLLYVAVAPTVGFAYAAAWMVLAVAATIWLRNRQPRGHELRPGQPSSDEHRSSGQRAVGRIALGWEGCRPGDPSACQPQLLDDAPMTSADLGGSPGQPLRTAAISALAFTALYLVHRLLQGTGPDSSTAAAVTTYNLAHRGALVASEVAVGLALLAFIPFLAALVPVIWRAGQEALAVAVTVSGGVFVAMGFVSNAAETALIWVADANQPAAVLALDELQGRTPVVWTITALLAALSLAIFRTGLVGRWLGVAGLVAAAIFLLGSIFSVLGPAPEGSSSLVGVGLFIVWMLALSAALWRAPSTSTTPGP